MRHPRRSLARVRLCRTAQERLRLRRFAMPERIFIVISTGAAPPSAPRRAWLTPGRGPRGFRPAPGRKPPCCRNASVVWTCRLRPMPRRRRRAFVLTPLRLDQAPIRRRSCGAWGRSGGARGERRGGGASGAVRLGTAATQADAMNGQSRGRDRMRLRVPGGAGRGASQRVIACRTGDEPRRGAGENPRGPHAASRTARRPGARGLGPRLCRIGAEPTRRWRCRRRRGFQSSNPHG